MKPVRWGAWAEYGAALLFPRRCPFCGALLDASSGQGNFCAACAAEEERLAHLPPRLPDTEHAFYAVHSAMAAYYYEGAVRSAILLCKRGAHPWYARELADCMAVRIWGAKPAAVPGRRPRYEGVPGFPLYHGIVPVPPHQPVPGVPGLPLLLARRLSILLKIPVMTPLRARRAAQAQKGLTRPERIRNVKDAYTCCRNADLSGKRILLVDDIITTGATVSACALALMQAGAIEVTAAAIAADEELPKEKQIPTEKHK